MKKLIILFLLLILASGCMNSESTEYKFWAHKTDNQITRLNDANIDYKIIEGNGGIDEIWVSEQDFDNVTACCT
ncbi:hypothetical protein ACFSTA_03295 [Ornithinibacillus salinisoli]|uniref:Uncharacterized protein n=1 Tax=Ornithinibacillus salinisoli TaxID=1848459 RepID=A0ABW4VZK4_9BACI